MSGYSDLETLTPAIIKYPFKKVLKALIDIKLGRRIGYNITIIFAAVLGLVIGYVFPGIGALMSFLLTLFLETQVSTAVISTISMAVSMILASSLLIYITKDIFKKYYISKYGVSNPDHKLTAEDKVILQYKFTDEGLSEDEIKEKIKGLEQRVDFLIDKMKLFKMTEEHEKRRTARCALYDLKRGDMSLFLDIYEDSFIKKQQRLEKLKNKPAEYKAEDIESERSEVDNGESSTVSFFNDSDSEEEAYKAASAGVSDPEEEEGNPKSPPRKSAKKKSDVSARGCKNNRVSLHVNLYGIKREPDKAKELKEMANDNRAVAFSLQ